MTINLIQTDTMVIFEHPVNEQMRLYLRLEYLFGIFQKNQLNTDPSANKHALFALLKILNVVDRPDLKSKLVQLLTMHVKNLGSLRASPEVHPEKLQEILATLEEHIGYLHDHQGKIGEDLRKNEFLNQIRMQLAHPAGPCETTLAPLQLWLNRSPESRQADLKIWSRPFLTLLNGINLLLRLVRHSTETNTHTANRGLYQQNQDPSSPYELIRISVDAIWDVFPEFSANKHRFMIRFMHLSLHEGRKPTQTQQDVEFYLRCCRL